MYVKSVARIISLSSHADIGYCALTLYSLVEGILVYSTSICGDMSVCTHTYTHTHTSVGLDHICRGQGMEPKQVGALGLFHNCSPALGPVYPLYSPAQLKFLAHHTESYFLPSFCPPEPLNLKSAPLSFLKPTFYCCTVIMFPFIHPVYKPQNLPSIFPPHPHLTFCNMDLLEGQI